MKNESQNSARNEMGPSDQDGSCLTHVDIKTPLMKKERMVIVCKAESDGEIKENNPVFVPGLDWQKDLNLSVIGPKDVKILHDSI